MNVKQMQLQLATAPDLVVVHGTRVSWLFTALLALVPHQRWLPRVLLPADVAEIPSPITRVIR